MVRANPGLELSLMEIVNRMGTDHHDGLLGELHSRELQGSRDVMRATCLPPADFLLC